MNNRHNFFTALAIVLFAGLLLNSPVFADTKHPGFSGNNSNQIALNENGKVRHNKHKRKHYVRNRIDVNDNGKIGPREKVYAKKLKNKADVNNDGKLNYKERHKAKKVMRRVDRKF